MQFFGFVILIWLLVNKNKGMIFFLMFVFARSFFFKQRCNLFLVVLSLRGVFQRRGDLMVVTFPYPSIRFAEGKITQGTCYLGK
ncbi:MAG: hypothetical protein COB12_08670 [Flavobacterium sp.]|nr:MAG: hypothetical protein COB12_08670 [Flavobacterium sp.]